MDLGLAGKTAVATGGSRGIDRATVDALVAEGAQVTPEEVAALVVMVASARAGNVTGAGFVIDGGLVSTL